jgi:hypothetical protein
MMMTWNYAWANNRREHIPPKKQTPMNIGLMMMGPQQVQLLFTHRNTTKLIPICPNQQQKRDGNNEFDLMKRNGVKKDGTENTGNFGFCAFFYACKNFISHLSNSFMDTQHSQSKG